MIILKIDKKKIIMEIIAIILIVATTIFVIFKNKLSIPQQSSENLQFSASGELIKLNETQELSATSSQLLKLFTPSDKLNTAVFDDYKFKSLKKNPDQQSLDVKPGRTNPFAPFNEEE